MSHSDLHAKTESLVSSQQTSQSTSSSGSSSAAESKVSASKKGAKNKKIYRYPINPYFEDLAQGGRDYMMIKVLEVQYNDLGGAVKDDANKKVEIPYESATNKTKEISRVYLPIPQSLQDSNQLTWGEDRVGPLGAAAYNVADQLLNSSDPSKTALQMIQGGIDTLKNITPDEKKVLLQFVAGQASSGLGGNISPQGIITRSTGQVLQSNLELLFQGVNLRTFAYPFTFAPRSEKEADEVKNIVRLFKKHSAAKKNTTSSAKGGIFMKSPDIFEIKFMRGIYDHPFLNQIKPCALTNLSFNYTGTGNWATYRRGEPVLMTMTLQFQEITPIYAEDYDSGNGKLGLGY